jgi:hypothetical protein
VAGTAQPNMGDMCLFEIVDLHARIFPKELAECCPELLAYHAKISALPAIAAYLPKRHEKINGNTLG